MKKTITLFTALLVAVSAAFAQTTITVSNTNDAGAGSLRQALADANNGDIIDFSVTGVITVASPLDISKDITIQGPGADMLAVDGNNATIVFEDANYGINTVEISGLEIRNGFSGAYGAGIKSRGSNLTLKYCHIHSNSLTASYGAAVHMDSGSSLTIENSTLNDNTVMTHGACIHMDEDSDLTISNSTIYNNSGSGTGQAIRAEGINVLLRSVTIAANGEDAIVLSDYEDFDNPANNIEASIEVINCIFDNPNGNYRYFGFGTENSLGNNISSDGEMSFLNGPGDLNNTSALLDPNGLQDNGGTMPTVALQCASPAVDAGTLVLALDQIGSVRYGSGPDIGALESNCTPPCVVNIPDANFKSILVGNAAINTNNDGEIQCSEAEAYNGGIFNNNEPGITDLTGIEAFTALTQLYCSNNNLTSLDVSQNTALTELLCAGNQLTSLDVSQNPDLLILRCGNNPISVLDVSATTSLEFLECDNNQLTSLAVSANTSLEFLKCSNNQLSTLDVSANTSLQSLECDNNQLTSLDVSQNPDLFILGCDNNQLTSLNVANGNNTNLFEIRAQGNSDLSCIQVDDANYSTNNWIGSFFAFDAGVNFSESCNSLPADNDCAGANDINSLFGGVVNTPITSSLYNHTGYTSEGTDPTAGFDCHFQGDTLQNTMWFSFDGDGNTYRIRTVDCSATNPHSDTQAALYSGDCNTLTPVLCNDDEDVNNSLFNVQVDLETVQGTTYYMLIDGYNGTEGEFCLEVTRQVTVNIFEADYQRVNLYPNPTEGVVSWNGITAQTAEVFDNTGRMVMNIAQPNGTVDISNLKEGIYIMMLHTEEGVYTSRVVKQ